MKHTPGPWMVDYLDKNGQRVVRNQFIEVCTCWHHSVKSIEQQMEANARLIAAAPELLVALKSLHERYVLAIGNEGPEAVAARIAITKATGAA